MYNWYWIENIWTILLPKLHVIPPVIILYLAIIFPIPSGSTLGISFDPVRLLASSLGVGWRTKASILEWCSLSWSSKCMLLCWHLNSSSAVSQRTAGWCPGCAVTVISALTSHSVLHCSLGLRRSLVTKLRGPGAVAPLAAVWVVLIWDTKIWWSMITTLQSYSYQLHNL